LLAAGCNKDQPPAAPPTASISSSPEIPVMGRQVNIVALGDSLFTGYGLDNGDSYPRKLEIALRARGINARIVNGGVTGDTTADGLQRLDFLLDAQRQKPDLVIISLGGNDMLRGLPPDQTRANLDAILNDLDRRGIKALLLGMLAPPNMGREYTRKFDAIYPALAQKHHAAVVPFFLQPLMGRPDLVQKDHIHPTELGIEDLVASTVGEVAEALGRKGK
jgi:acyl-CoA thioesterase-1